ncbi:MAG: hypothetical protein WCG93_12370 [Paludibacter sp.]
MKLTRFRLLFLVAALMAVVFTVCDASACNSAIHFASNLSTEHVGMAVAAFTIVPLSTFVKDNCTISHTELTELALKYGKIKILSVVIEAPSYDDNGKLTDNGEFYSYACRRPDQGTIRLMMDYAKKGNTEQYIDCFIKNIVVGGDVEKLKSDGLVYLGLTTQVDNFLKPYESFLANA